MAVSGILGEAWVNIGANTAPLAAGLNGAKAQVSQATMAMQARLRTLGMSMTIVGALGTAAFALTVKSAMAFQKELAQVSTQLNETTMHFMPLYKKELESMSMAFGEATTTLANGLYDILSAAIDPSKALYVLEEAGKAAVAGITNTGIAADALTSILNSYGFSAEKAGEISDKMFATVLRGKITFEELASGIGKVSASAAKTGLSFDELGASIATLTRSGVRSDEAMTAINGALMGFLKPTDEARKAAAEFGLELNTTTIKTIGLRGAMEKLKDATAEQLAQIFPNIRGLKGIITAMGDLEGYMIDYNLMLNAAGLTQAAFEKQTATVAFKLEQLKKTFGVLAIQIGDVLIPVVSDMVEWLGKVVLGIADWIEANPELISTLVKFGAALSVFTMAGGLLILMNLYTVNLKVALIGMASTIKMIIPNITQLSTAWASFGAINIATSTTMAGGTIPLLSKLGLALMKFPGPVGLTVIAVAGLVLAFKKWQEYSDKVREANERLKASLMTKDEIMDRMGVISKVITGAQEQLAGNEFTFAGSDIMRKQIKDLTIELDALNAKLKEGKTFIDPFAQSFSDKMLMMKKGVENLEAAIGTIVTNTKDLTSEIDLLTKEQAAYGTTIEANIGYYKQLIEKYNEYDIVLQTELMSLKEGTEAWNAKKAEIYDNITALNAVQKSLDDLIKPLEGVDLISAKMALLGDSIAEIPAKLGYLREAAVLLKTALDEAKPDTIAWREAALAYKENQDAIDSLTGSFDEYGDVGKELIIELVELTDKQKKLQEEIDKVGVDKTNTAYQTLKITYNGVGKEIDVVVTKLTNLEEAQKTAEEKAKNLADAYKTVKDEIYELTHTEMENNIRKLDEQKQAYIDLGMSIDVVNKWYDEQIAKLKELNPELDKTTKELKEAGDFSVITTAQLNEAFGGATKSINTAASALSNFTKEGLIAAIVTVKMKFLPLIYDIKEAMAGLSKAFLAGQLGAVDYNALQIFYNKQLSNIYKEQAEQISILKQGLAEYNALIKGMSGGSASSFTIPSYQTGTPSVPKTGLALVHRGEEINPPGQRSYDYSKKYNININNPVVRNDSDIYLIKREIEKVLDDTSMQFRRG